ncbi:MAG: energy transducer TonB [Acidobacteria bacterium]|nr:energy transducer TonB [Acidobacteriota bacterium]
MLKPFTVCLGIMLLSASVGLAVQEPTRLPSQPQPVSPVVPPYPPIARAACVQGPVAVVVEVDPMGNVTATDVLYGHPLLWQTALKAASSWQFDTVRDESNRRREVLRFAFHILPFEIPEKKLEPLWSSRTDVEVKAHPFEPSCDDCTEKRRRQLRRGGCPAQP